MTKEGRIKQSELESVIIGSVINNESLLDSKYLEQNIQPEMFVSEVNRILYASILNMHFQNLHINDISLVQYLASSQQLEKVGGVAHIAELKNDSSLNNDDYYLSELKKMYQKREAWRILKETAEKMPDLSTEPTETIADIIDRLTALTDINNNTKILEMKDLYSLLKKSTDAQIAKGEESTGILSGFKVFDEATDGFQKGELTILAARPSIGKTSMALSMCMNIAKSHNVAFISLETPDKTIAQKVASLITEVPAFSLRRAKLNANQYEKVFTAGKSQFDERSFFLVDKPYINITEIKSVIRHLILCNKVEMIFIDYIGLIDALTPESPVYEKQSVVSKALKGMTREFQVPICALCQVSRDSEKESKAPTLANLRGSGSIEQDADVVMFLHGSRFIPKEQETAERDFIIAKNRNGECAVDKVDFNKKLSRYENHINEEI